MSGSRAALLVGADRYDDPKLASLRAPAHDLEALEGVLADPQIGGFEVRRLLNRAHHEVLEELEGFFVDRHPDDLLLLYFSCHGVKDVSGRLHFATTTTRTARLGSTGLSSAWVNEQLDRSRCRRAVLLLDCCYSGAFARGLAPRAATEVPVAEQLGGRGRAVITASDAMEYAWEGDDLAVDEPKPSVFTSALVNGLSSGDADRDGDGLVSVSDLYDYLYDRVRASGAQQTPTKHVFGEQGELVVARNPRPRPAEPVPLPHGLEVALYDRRPFIRRAAAVELGQLLSGEDPGLAAAAAAALAALAEDEDAEVRAAATEARGASGAEVVDAPASARVKPEKVASPPAGPPAGRGAALLPWLALLATVAAVYGLLQVRGAAEGELSQFAILVLTAVLCVGVGTALIGRTSGTQIDGTALLTGLAVVLVAVLYASSRTPWDLPPTLPLLPALSVCLGVCAWSFKRGVVAWEGIGRRLPVAALAAGTFAVTAVVDALTAELQGPQVETYILVGILAGAVACTAPRRFAGGALIALAGCWAMVVLIATRVGWTAEYLPWPVLLCGLLLLVPGALLLRRTP